MCSSGVPQVLLPAWADCYDFGNRVELLGVGRWANKKAIPRWKHDELAEGLSEVLLGSNAAKFRGRAKDLALLYPPGAGREKAAREILAAM
jgi:UDP:flavonoid glycosyltransferase YjiC (YdhE family)